VSTSTTTQVVTAPAPTTTDTNTGAGAPYRPTLSSDSTSPSPPSISFCPTGFYACLARAGGGCCQTGRDCQTYSCPPVPLTTIVDTNGVTVVVPATDLPSAQPSKTCAGGWYLCGTEAGPQAGCCPNGYSCGTASCTIISADSTAQVQKVRPSSAAGSISTSLRFLAVLAILAMLAM
jgi:progranulin